MIGSEALGVTRQVTAVLEALGVPYVIGGSLASIVHGMVRTTLDADILAELQPEHAATLVAALGEASERQWRDVLGGHPGAGGGAGRGLLAPVGAGVAG